MKVDSKIERERKEIKKITKEIIYLANRRLKLTLKIGLMKKRLGLPIEAPEVERDLRIQILKVCKQLNLDSKFALRLLNLLIGKSMELQMLQNEKDRITDYEIFARAKNLEEVGKRIIHLELEELEFGSLPNMVRKANRAIRGSHIRYSAVEGLSKLRGAIAQHLNEDFGVDIKSDQVLITSDPKFAIYTVMENILEPGGGIITFEPLCSCYKECAHLIGGRSINIPTHLERDWMPDIEMLQRYIGEDVKMIVLNYPCNPTGKCLNKSTLREIVELAAGNGLTILSDESYSIHSFTPMRSILEFTDCKSIMVSSFSKSYGLTGFGISYLVSTSETVRRLAQFQRMSMNSPPESVQLAALKSLELRDDVKKYSRSLQKRMRFVSKTLRQLQTSFYEPDGGFFIFPRIDLKGFESEGFAGNLLEQKGVAIAPGTSFGCYTKYIRISLCQSEDLLMEGLKKIGGFLK